jgi:hypothetical protein
MSSKAKTSKRLQQSNISLEKEENTTVLSAKDLEKSTAVAESLVAAVGKAKAVKPVRISVKKNGINESKTRYPPVPSTVEKAKDKVGALLTYINEGTKPEKSIHFKIFDDEAGKILVLTSKTLNEYLAKGFVFHLPLGLVAQPPYLKLAQTRFEDKTKKRLSSVTKDIGGDILTAFMAVGSGSPARIIAKLGEAIRVIGKAHASSLNVSQAINAIVGFASHYTKPGSFETVDTNSASPTLKQAYDDYRSNFGRQQVSNRNLQDQIAKRLDNEAINSIHIHIDAKGERVTTASKGKPGTTYTIVSKNNNKTGDFTQTMVFAAKLSDSRQFFLRISEDFFPGEPAYTSFIASLPDITVENERGREESLDVAMKKVLKGSKEKLRSDLTEGSESEGEPAPDVEAPSPPKNNKKAKTAPAQLEVEPEEEPVPEEQTNANEEGEQPVGRQVLGVHQSGDHWVYDDTDENGSKITVDNPHINDLGEIVNSDGDLLTGVHVEDGDIVADAAAEGAESSSESSGQEEEEIV